MQVVRSKVLGFCMGVRRAVKMAHTEVDRAASGGGKVYTIGPLIHNPVVLQDLKSRGLEELEGNAGVLNFYKASALPKPQVDVIPSGGYGEISVIIRAHGIDPHIEEDLRSRAVNIVDATCPNVKNSQLKAKALVEAGYYLFLAGDPQHSEISGILGYSKSCSSSLSVVSNAAEAEDAAEKLFKTDKNAKTALIGQTTITEDEYSIIGKAILKYFPETEIVQTICTATNDRQKALRELLKEVDAVLIVGGKESANTRRLLAIAKASGKPCALIENSRQIPFSFYSYDFVGISAGASTPDFIINEIEVELLR